jgi:glycosyltransferase involved in cell wall biosynthesis
LNRIDYFGEKRTTFFRESLQMNIVFVGHRCCDHSPSSGYDQVCSIFPEAGWLDGRAFEDNQIQWHRKAEFGIEETQIFHVFYGDCSGKGLPEILRVRFPKASIVSTIHQPVSRLRQDAIACRAIKNSDGIITVSKEQVCELREFELDIPIFMIPHGVWAKVFRPNIHEQFNRRDVLIVGSFLRDWEGAKKVVKLLTQMGIRSIALGAGAIENLINLGSNIEVPPRVSEVELASLYHRSAAVFLPLTQATASNALLEAMAAGCPIICPRMNSLTDEYLGYESDSFEIGQYEVAAEKILYYIKNPSARIAKQNELLKRVEEFDWAYIKERFARVYQDILSRKSV